MFWQVNESFKPRGCGINVALYGVSGLQHFIVLAPGFAAELNPYRRIKTKRKSLIPTPAAQNSK